MSSYLFKDLVKLASRLTLVFSRSVKGEDLYAWCNGVKYKKAKRKTK